MSTFSQAFQNIPDEQAPVSLHKGIMRRLRFLRVRFPLLLAILCLTVLWSSWNLWDRVLDTGAYVVLADMVGNFQWSELYMSELWQTFIDITTLSVFGSILLNIIFAGFIFTCNTIIRKKLALGR